MDIRDRAGLKSAAEASVSAAGGLEKKLVMIYAGSSAALALLITVVDYFLGHGISDTGGLSGMGLRSILSTMQLILPIAQLLILPFWELGFQNGVLKLARQESAGFEDLLWGFRNFGRSARYLLLRGVLYIGAAFLGSYLGTQAFMFTPWAAPLFEVMIEGTADESALMEVMAGVQVPLLLCNLAFFLLLLIPVMFRYRLAGLVLLENPENGALAALRGSRRLMRGHSMDMLRLDLSLWWFYAVDILMLLIAYADQLLPLLGVQIPVSADAAFFICYVVSILLQLAWYYHALTKVQVTYVHAYEALKNPAPEIISKKPVNQPWNYEV